MSWYVLYLRPRTEKKLAEFCESQKLEHYLPLRQETKIYQRRRVTVEKPVFQGYFFVSFDSDERLAVLKTNNVIRILIPSDEQRLLHELAQIRQALTADPTLTSTMALAQGRKVCITSGPFMGIEGFVNALKGKTKVRLNVDLIGRAIVVEVEREFLELVD